MQPNRNSPLVSATQHGIATHTAKMLAVIALIPVTLATITVSTAAFGQPIPTVVDAIAPITIDSGQISGKVLQSGVRAWLGVPYARPPLRELRWRPPQRVQWAGVYNADRFAPQCVQPLRGSSINHYFGHEATSEDCLYLNIWAPPGSQPGDDLPVVVWIYGGGFTIGSASMQNYSGEHLAAKGVVYVGVSYRIGALGFMAHPGLTAESPNRASGNYGLLDQIAALEWVRRNIDRFGGDASRVTIMGQSAGAASVSLLQVSPLARGLFRRIIGMSGSAFARIDSTLQQAEMNGLAFERALGVDSIVELRDVPADRILAEQADCQLRCLGDIRVGPIIDGYVLPDRPEAVFARGEQYDVPVMIGFTRDEGFSPIARAASLRDYTSLIEATYGDAGATVLQLYPAANDTAAIRAARDIARDSTVALNMKTWAQLQVRNGKQSAFVYMFSRVHPYKAGIAFADHNPATVGAYHTADVPYWLQTLDSLNLFRETRSWSDFDRELAELMSDAIVAFADTGDPSTDDLQWPALSDANDQVMEFGREGRLQTVTPWPNAEGVEFFETYEQRAAARPAE